LATPVSRGPLRHSSDLIGEPSDDHAEKCFKLLNPFYFILPGLPDGGLKCLQH